MSSTFRWHRSQISKVIVTEDGDDLGRLTTFAGTLTDGDLSLPIRIRVRVGRDGELRLHSNRVPLTADAVRLLFESPDERRLTFDGVSKNGTAFHCDNLVRTGQTTHDGAKGSAVTFNFRYSRARFVRSIAPLRELPVIRFLLRGFECFPEVTARCPLGEVLMRGKYPAPNDGSATGVLYVSATAAPPDLENWKAEVERLTHHILDLMSLALAHHVRAPIRETWTGEEWECDVSNVTFVRRNAQHVMHPMRLQPHLDAAVSSFFAPPIAVKNLGFALEWFAMPATYTEMRLMNVMTALENLIDSNLADSDKLFLPEKKFKRVAADIRQAVADQLASVASDETTRSLVQELVSALQQKVPDLNRRPLADKLKTLADRWQVPLDGLPVDDIGNAISARNKVVHRGYYQESHAGTPSSRSLWGAYLLMREVAVRFVLTIIGFKGTYLSFRGGQHDVAFPPVSSGPS
jgi:hypothetical protein